jgi:hypothetical protein
MKGTTQKLKNATCHGIGMVVRESSFFHVGNKFSHKQLHSLWYKCHFVYF